MALMSTSQADTHTFEHPTLGSLTGVISPATPDIVTFRAIPYANLPGRFHKSLLREDLDGLSRNFTKPGYAFPHTFPQDDVNGGGPYPGEQPIQTSEFESLILELNIPKEHLQNVNKSTPLPVMTYIHGGAFIIGKIDAYHNTAFMSQHSLALSEPVITIAIQYRLGALGFMPTPNGEKNLGLLDQRNALLWIQKFINGFGGDNKNVTLFGESAGGYSICYHMLSHVPPTGPLFNRAIIMSGVVGPMSTPISQEKGDVIFQQITQDLNITEKGEAALSALNALDVEKLVEASDAWIARGNSYWPIDDSSFFRENVTWNKIPELLGNCEWVTDVIVGNTAFEGLAWPSVAKSLTPARFAALLNVELSHDSATKVMEAYGVSMDMDQNLFLTPAMRWTGEIIFDGPIHALTTHFPANSKQSVYRYIFNTRNPFPNATFYQQAHHWVDVYFVFRAMQFRLPAHLKALSDKHAQLWIDFANGKAPWTKKSRSSSDDSLIMVADERDGWVERTLTEYAKIEHDPTRFTRLEVLLKAWGEKTGQRWAPLDMKAL